MSTATPPRDPAPADGSGAMFDRIAGRYDLLNRLTSLGLDRGWRRALIDALALDDGLRLLDLATGTGDVALAAARRHPGLRVVGIDPSEGMLAIARRKLADAGVGDRVELRPGDARALPLADGSVDRACIAFGIRNVPDRALALRELVRVTRAGGRIAVLELGRPQGGWLAPAVRFHTERLVPWLGARLSGAPAYRYLPRSIAAFPAPGDFADQLRRAGVGQLRVRALGLGAVYLFVGTVGTEPGGHRRPTPAAS